MGHLHTAKVKGEKLQRKVRGRVDSLHSHVASTVVVINAKSGAQPRHTILGLFEEREPYSAQPRGLRERGSGRCTGSQERGWGKREKGVSRRLWCAFQEVRSLICSLMGRSTGAFSPEVQSDRCERHSLE